MSLINSSQSVLFNNFICQDTEKFFLNAYNLSGSLCHKDVAIYGNTLLTALKLFYFP